MLLLDSRVFASSSGLVGILLRVSSHYVLLLLEAFEIQAPALADTTATFGLSLFINFPRFGHLGGF